MNDGTSAAINETPVFFPAGEETLFGIFTHAAGEPNGMGVVLVQGGSPHMVSFQRNRVGLRLAHRLAERGFSVLRFDWHGVGESTGQVKFVLDDPFATDVEAAATWLRGQGFRRLLVVGSCFGGRSALAAAPRIEGLEAIVLAAMYISDQPGILHVDQRSVSDYVRRGLRLSTISDLFHREKRRFYSKIILAKARAILGRFSQKLNPGDHAHSAWVSPQVMRHLEHLVERRIPTLLLYGNKDEAYSIFLRAQTGRLGRIIQRKGADVEVSAEVSGCIHGYASLAVQDSFVDAVEGWIQRRALAGEARAVVEEPT